MPALLSLRNGASMCMLPPARRSLLSYDSDFTSDSELPALSRPRMLVQQGSFDPGERIPSYESSQEQHCGQVGTSPARSNITTGTANDLLSSLSHGHNNYAAHLPPIVTTTNTCQHVSETATSRTRERERGRERERASSPVRSSSRLVKSVGLKFLNARQHFLLATCRDMSLIPCVVGLCRSWWVILRPDASGKVSSGLTTARVSEHFLTGLWCIVAGYLLFSVLDGLMVRWIVGYSITGAIVRMAAMSAILVAVEEYLVAAFSAEGFNYALHTWILISCALTVLFIAQNFITSNIDLKGRDRPRFFDFYKIVVFAVVPVGIASFITMIGLLRSLLILRLDIDLQRT